MRLSHTQASTKGRKRKKKRETEENNKMAKWQNGRKAEGKAKKNKVKSLNYNNPRL